jgi:predicted nucleic acid-binding protein
MWRVVTSTFAALTVFATVAAAQAPCTTDANRVVAEVYRHTLERGVDPAAQQWARQLASGQVTVKELVRRVAKSQEYMQRFGQTESGEGQPFERSVARLYRHILARQADAGGQRNYTRVAQQRGLAAVVDGLIDSAEYNNNFGDSGVPGSGGLRFCGAGAAAPQSSQMAPRFEALDRNNDGRVTRREWDGTNVAFNEQDWDGDGVLSGEEVRAGGRRAGRGRIASDYDFDALDINNNNRIERREWQARLELFDRLDVNGDNFLSRAEVDGPGAPTAGTFGQRIATSGQRIAVAADRGWTDTGINVRVGQQLTINADGRIRLSRDSQNFVTAAGASDRVANATLPNAPLGGMVARFGDSEPVFIGQSRTFRATQGGRLYLGVNDSYFDDNTGQFNVTVDVN